MSGRESEVNIVVATFSSLLDTRHMPSVVSPHSCEFALELSFVNLETTHAAGIGPVSDFDNVRDATAPGEGSSLKNKHRSDPQTYLPPPQSRLRSSVSSPTVPFSFCLVWKGCLGEDHQAGLRSDHRH